MNGAYPPSPLACPSDICQAPEMTRPPAEARRHLTALGLPDRDLGELPNSARRFGDGAQYRIEIPSVEGPEPFRAVHSVEVCLFGGPRAAWAVGAQATAPAGRVAAGSLRGADQLAYGIEDVLRGCALGVRSILVADSGQLWVLGRMKRSG